MMKKISHRKIKPEYRRSNDMLPLMASTLCIVCLALLGGAYVYVTTKSSEPITITISPPLRAELNNSLNRLQATMEKLVEEKSTPPQVDVKIVRDCPAPERHHKPFHRNRPNH